MGYDPELHISPELDQDTVSYYLTIIGILRWMVEFGRINMITIVLLLSSQWHSLEIDILMQECMLWHILARNTSPDYYMILCSQK